MNFTQIDVIFSPSIARIILSVYAKVIMDVNVYFFSQKKKILSLINTETKLTHDFYIFFISVKFPRAANIHFLQSTSNYIIRENVSKKKKKTDEIAFKNQIFEFQIRVKILFLISWKFRLPFLIR